MNPPNHPDQTPRNVPFRYARDAGNRVISIPTNQDLEGYLVYDIGTNGFAQVRFLKAETPAAQWAYKTVWKNFRNRSTSSIFPEMLAMELRGDTPFYVSKLPSGEPLERCLKRSGPIQFQSAVPLVLAFVESLAIHGFQFYERFAISPQSIWLEKTGAQPRLILGDLAPLYLKNAEEANVRLCLALLRYLSGNPRRNQSFQGLCREVEEGPQLLSALGNTLKKYTDPKRNPGFGTGFHEPIPILQQLASPLVMNPDSSSLTNRALPEGTAAFKWPSLPGLESAF